LYTKTNIASELRHQREEREERERTTPWGPKANKKQIKIAVKRIKE
jgi:hypothetical protein